jgi:hypothetical protein
MISIEWPTKKEKDKTHLHGRQSLLFIINAYYAKHCLQHIHPTKNIYSIFIFLFGIPLLYLLKYFNFSNQEIKDHIVLILIFEVLTLLSFFGLIATGDRIDLKNLKKKYPTVTSKAEAKSIFIRKLSTTFGYEALAKATDDLLTLAESRKEKTSIKKYIINDSSKNRINTLILFCFGAFVTIYAKSDITLDEIFSRLEKNTFKFEIVGLAAMIFALVLSWIASTLLSGVGRIILRCDLKKRAIFDFVIREFKTDLIVYGQSTQMTKQNPKKPSIKNKSTRNHRSSTLNHKPPRTALTKALRKRK